jgi:hypothetical protein
MIYFDANDRIERLRLNGREIREVEGVENNEL